MSKCSQLFNSFLCMPFVNFFLKKRLYKRIGEKIKNKEKIKIAFECTNFFFNHYFSVIEAMAKDNFFEVTIIVPFTLGNFTNGRSVQDVQQETIVQLQLKFPTVNIKKIESNIKRIAYSDLKDFDILFIQRPYEGYRKNFLLTALVLYSGFMLPGGENGGYLELIAKHIAKTKIDYYFLENEFISSLFEQTKYPLKGKGVVVGYPKFDELIKTTTVERTHKRILLCPHHSLPTGQHLSFSTSNFLQHADFFLELPSLYPKIEFIFRPHPTLRFRLTTAFWGKEKTDAYFEKMSSYSNVIYQSSGAYIDDFVNSDGMIHDCCSFMAEYMVTGHPVCYILKNCENKQTDLSPSGEKLLSHHYHVSTKEDIINFIDNQVIKGDDPMKQERLVFIQSYLLLNHPHVGDKIVEFFKNKLQQAVKK